MIDDAKNQNLAKSVDYLIPKQQFTTFFCFYCQSLKVSMYENIETPFFVYYLTTTVRNTFSNNHATFYRLSDLKAVMNLHINLKPSILLT